MSLQTQEYPRLSIALLSCDDLHHQYTMGKSDVLKIHRCERFFNVVAQVQAAEAVMFRGGRQVSPSSLSA